MSPVERTAQRQLYLFHDLPLIPRAPTTDSILSASPSTDPTSTQGRGLAGVLGRRRKAVEVGGVARGSWRGQLRRRLRAGARAGRAAVVSRTDSRELGASGLHAYDGQAFDCCLVRLTSPTEPAARDKTTGPHGPRLRQGSLSRSGPQARARERVGSRLRTTQLPTHIPSH